MKNKYLIILLIVLILSGCDQVVPNLPGTNPKIVLLSGNTLVNRNSNYDMGNCLINTGGIESEFSITNEGDSVLKIIKIELEDTSSFLISETPDFSISPGATEKFKVLFNPLTTGEKTAKLIIEHNVSGTDRGPYEVMLEAACEDTSLISITGNKSNVENGVAINAGIFDIDNQAENQIQFTITNNGSKILELTGEPFVTLSTNSSFVISDQPDPEIIPGESTSFSIHFNPGERGDKNVKVRIFHNSKVVANPFSFNIYCLGENKPVMPGNLQMQMKSDLSYTMTWDDNSNNETMFIVERKKQEDISFVQIGTTDANVSSFTDASISNGIIFIYRVYALNEIGKSNYSNNLQSDAIATGTPDMIIKQGATIINYLSNFTADTVEVDRSTIVQFTIENNGNAALELSGNPIVDIGNTTDFQTMVQPSGEIAPGEESHFAIVLSPGSVGNYTGNVMIYHNTPGLENPFLFTIIYRGDQLPKIPTKLGRSFRNSEEIQLIWQDTSDTEEGFILEVVPENEMNYYEIATLPANTSTYLHQGLSEYTQYTYRIKAFNSIGESGYSIEKETNTLYKGPHLVVHNGLTVPERITYKGNQSLGYIHFFNYGDEELSFSIEEDTGWLHFEGNTDFFTGIIVPDDETEGNDDEGGIEVFIDTTNLVGAHFATIPIISSSGNYSVTIGFFVL